ncbi:methyl-accepting chemotaxis protein, partial [Vibrio parahaemolyticus]
MNHYLRFFIALVILCASSHTYALEARIGYMQMRGCGSQGDWVDPYKVNTCFLDTGYFDSCTFEKTPYADARYPYQTVCDNGLGLAYYEVRCPENSEFDPSTLRCKSVCEYGENPDGTCMDACQFKQSIGDTVKLHWHPAVYGELVTGACYGDYGATRCEMTKNESTIICTGVPDGQYTPDSQCSLRFAYTGRQCDGGTLFWGVNGPDEPIIPPDTPEDPTHDPDDPTGEI